MVQAVDWGAARQVMLVTVASQVLTFRKHGMGNLNKKLWSIPGLGEILEALVGVVMEGGLDEGTRNARMLEALKGALANASAGTSATPGQVAVVAGRSAIPALLDLICEDTILASEDERGPYRAWLDTLGPREILEAVSGWLKLNMPEAHGPFVRAAGKVLFKGHMLLERIGGRETSEPKPSSEPAPTETPTSDETVAEPLAA